MDIKLTDTALKNAVTRFKKLSFQETGELLTEDLVFGKWISDYMKLLDKQYAIPARLSYELHRAFLIVREAYRYGEMPGKTFREENQKDNGVTSIKQETLNKESIFDDIDNLRRLAELQQIAIKILVHRLGDYAGISANDFELIRDYRLDVAERNNTIVYTTQKEKGE